MILIKSKDLRKNNSGSIAKTGRGFIVMTVAMTCAGWFGLSCVDRAREVNPDGDSHSSSVPARVSKLAADMSTVKTGGSHNSAAISPAARLTPDMATARLKKEVAKARETNPAIFQAVKEASRRVVELDRKKRSRLAIVSPMFKAMGKEAFLPVMDMLMTKATLTEDMPDSATIAMKVGLLEAAGWFRDERAAPVLNSVLDEGGNDFLVLKAAAEALGKLGNDESVSKLVDLTREHGDKQLAAFAGLGECRRYSAAEYLAQCIAARPEESKAWQIIKSLGRIGSSWAWKTPAVAKSGEGEATRAIAAQALVGAFISYQGYLRETAAKALLVVDDPNTPDTIQSAIRTARPELIPELEDLKRRFAESPLH